MITWNNLFTQNLSKTREIETFYANPFPIRYQIENFLEISSRTKE